MKNGNEEMSNLIEIENLKKDLALAREETQTIELSLRKAIDHLHENIKWKDERIRELEQINKKHQDLNGKLQIELNRHLGDI